MEDAREDIDKGIGVENEGWVKTKGYDLALQTNNDLRRAWMSSVDKDDLQGINPAGIWPCQAP
ncbi:hypothetical protein CVT25_007367 [Psilocybe cyanescens]|uniref:Uncharacterized protein n=1 Tax=Psilocybe cyanescens TaxID=93625 RepID=A0A409XJJ0_PSICY|nr:hypothetical protein CVT25_007367 [Psilocybe cyanescens]